MSATAGGIRPWVVQRLSAVYMVVALCIFCFTLMFGGLNSYQEWQAWLSSPFWNALVIIFWLVLFAHAWIGFRDVIMDYASHDGLRFTLLSLLGIYLIAMTVWMAIIMIMAVSA